ncbi:hypothetical protein EDB81DRAFT_949464 [Dactylonectria macrodidyma]|uniref:PD-(D/E)XK nuclease-like domain-containing protein n=1 Tax=Dactylonectria macrodidyma TaxID=307937 RepID=A0A9P9E9Y1_9HYPO|nr:hypothetical protein EDB81DRAFT_949464 [Dactylonectria macrodidyma]
MKLEPIEERVELNQSGADSAPRPPKRQKLAEESVILNDESHSAILSSLPKPSLTELPPPDEATGCNDGQAKLSLTGFSRMDFVKYHKKCPGSLRKLCDDLEALQHQRSIKRQWLLNNGFRIRESLCWKAGENEHKLHQSYPDVNFILDLMHSTRQAIGDEEWGEGWEENWNHRINGPILQFVFGKNTSATISTPSISSPSPSKYIDYCVTISHEAGSSDMKAIEELVYQKGVSSINHTEASPLWNQPIAISITTTGSSA